MAKSVNLHHPFLLHDYHLLLLILCLSFHHSIQLQPSQSQSLLKLQQLLNFPPTFTTSSDSHDFCSSSTEPTPFLTVSCYEDDITQLHIRGNDESNDGFGPLVLPQSFSTDSFFANIAILSSLKVLTLVSLGLSGSLPESVGQLSSLEILNVSSNYFTGRIPEKIASLRNLQTLILDHNRFSGEVPGWLSLLPGLAVLSLKNNSFGGSLPECMTNLVNLRILSLSKNHLFGGVPELHNLTNLQVLDLGDNYFGPHFPYLNNKLVSIVLRNNSFQFGIPSELGSFHQLQKLDISLNRFAGPILPSLLTLPSMNYLDVSRNRFTGMLFENMSCNPELAYVDLSSNLFVGELPTCLNFSSKARIVRYGSNCLSNKEQGQKPSIFCHKEALAVNILPHDEEMHKKWSYGNKAVIASSTMGATVGGIAIVSVVFLIIRRINGNFAVRKPHTRLIMDSVSNLNTVKLLSDARYISQTMKLGASLPPYRSFGLEELKEATNNFYSSNLLTENPQCLIYKGKLADGTLVAIRSLPVRKKHSQQSYTHDIELISKLRHSHLVSALGHCFVCSMNDSSTSRLFLVFEFVSNGTLRDHVSGIQGRHLTWTQRIGAAIGVARGVEFLHTGIVPGMFSNNLKITDALLDHDLQVKVSCCNMLLLTENKEMVGSAVSFPGTKQNSGERRKQEDKKDIYDVGVILLELIVGRPILTQNDVMVSKDILQVSMTVDEKARRSIVDPGVHKECSDESLKIMMGLTIRCLSGDPSDRPSIGDVLWNLQFVAQVQDSQQQ